MSARGTRLPPPRQNLASAGVRRIRTTRNLTSTNSKHTVSRLGVSQQIILSNGTSVNQLFSRSSRHFNLWQLQRSLLPFDRYHRSQTELLQVKVRLQMRAKKQSNMERVFSSDG